MHIGTYLELVYRGQQDLAKAFELVAKKHGDEPDIKEMCQLLACWSNSLAERIHPFTQQYRAEKDNEPDRLLSAFFGQHRTGSLALLRDLHDLWLMANEAEISAVLLRQAASALRDTALIGVCDELEEKASRQLAWLVTRLKSAAPQVLIAAG
ncbi:molybdopterin oxidoreductase [Spirosoma koreense]